MVWTLLKTKALRLYVTKMLQFFLNNIIKPVVRVNPGAIIIHSEENDLSNNIYILKNIKKIIICGIARRHDMDAKENVEALRIIKNILCR